MARASLDDEADRRIVDLTAAGRLFFHILGDQPPQQSGIGFDGFRLLPMFLFHLFRQAQQSPCIAHNLRQPLLSLLLIIPVNARFPFQAAAKIACQSLLLYPRLLVCAVYFQQPPRQLFDPFPQQPPAGYRCLARLPCPR